MLKKYIMLLGIIVIIITGCSSGKSNKNTIGEKDIQIVHNFELGKAKEDIDVRQPYWNNFIHEFAKGKDGYYSTQKLDKLIVYIDEKTMNGTVLCAKADCEHNNSQCNAYIAPNSHVTGSIWYYKDYLYMIKVSNGNAILEQITPDATSRKELFEIGKAEDGSASINLVFANDCVYIYDRMGSFGMEEDVEINIRKRSLDGKTDENIFSYIGQMAMIEAAESFGNKLFFQLNKINYDKETKLTTTKTNLYFYDYDTGRVNQFDVDNISDYYVDEQNSILYYYVINEGLYKKDINKDNDTKIFQADTDLALCQISGDENYIYLCNGRWKSTSGIQGINDYLVVLDTNGREVNRIPTNEKTYATHFGDSKYLLFEGVDMSIQNIGYIEKSKIEEAATWNKVRIQGLNYNY